MQKDDVGLSIYFDRRMIRILLLGAISGFPWVIIGSALSLWSSSFPATLLAYVVLLLVGVMTWEGVGGSRPEGLWSEHLGDVPQQWLEGAWGRLMSELERVL